MMNVKLISCRSSQILSLFWFLHLFYSTFNFENVLCLAKGLLFCFWKACVSLKTYTIAKTFELSDFYFIWDSRVLFMNARLRSNFWTSFERQHSNIRLKNNRRNECIWKSNTNETFSIDALKRCDLKIDINNVVILIAQEQNRNSLLL